ncbi:MAG: serine hydrolase [Flavobacteriales bacterium]|nr:serine hydrolase [Flavobacteriales bacterium]
MKKNAVSLVSMAMAATLGGIASYAFLDPPAPITPAAARATAKAACAYSVARVEGFNRVRPLLYSEPMCESPRFEGLRASVSNLVNDLKASGQVLSASVYIRDFKQAEWTWYNGDELYDPGSLLKIPLLLTYLSMAEEDPSLMERTYTCELVDANVPQHTAFPAAQIQPNVAYTVEQLLEFSIAQSDNRATTLLMRHVPVPRYVKTYTDLGLPKPDVNARAYPMNVRDYSVFMKALFNSSFLGPMRSEYALELMTRSTFTKGLVAGLPQGVDVAHKFGEEGTELQRQLHEAGLVYADGNPYLITVMTRGSNPDSLASAISSISRLVYDRMSVN